MVLILVAASAAALLKYFYDRRVATDPGGTTVVVDGLYRSTAIVGALISFIVVLMDALRGVSRLVPSLSGGAAPARPLSKFGQTVASDVASED